MDQNWHRHLENTLEIDQEILLWCFQVEFAARRGMLVVPTGACDVQSSAERYASILNHELESLGLDLRTRMSANTRMHLLRQFQPCLFEIAADNKHELLWQVLPMIQSAAVTPIRARARGWAFDRKSFRRNFIAFCNE